VLVRRGCFVRTADGVRSVLDPTLAYWQAPGEEELFDHPHPDGDDCTEFAIDPGVLTGLSGAAPAFEPRLIPTSPRVDLEHRLLLAAAGRGARSEELLDRAVALITDLLQHSGNRRRQRGRPATDRLHRHMVDRVRETLVADPGRPLVRIARELGVSPHHLSRVFRSVTGETISRYRMRLRARTALEHLADEEASLARLAADAGFADQSHLCRVIWDEAGATPRALRRLLAQTAASTI
jgi:AraC-like DNA-binding protein